MLVHSELHACQLMLISSPCEPWRAFCCRIHARLPWGRRWIWHLGHGRALHGCNTLLQIPCLTEGEETRSLVGEIIDEGNWILISKSYKIIFEKVSARSRFFSKPRNMMELTGLETRWAPDLAPVLLGSKLLFGLCQLNTLLSNQLECQDIMEKENCETSFCIFHERCSETSSRSPTWWVLSDPMAALSSTVEPVAHFLGTKRRKKCSNKLMACGGLLHCITTSITGCTSKQLAKQYTSVMLTH